MSIDMTKLIIGDYKKLLSSGEFIIETETFFELIDNLVKEWKMNFKVEGFHIIIDPRDDNEYLSVFDYLKLHRSTNGQEEVTYKVKMLEEFE